MSSGLALRVKTSRSLGCFEASSLDIGIGKRRIARHLHRENAHAGRQIGADGLQLLPDFVAGRRPERHHDLGARGPDQSDPMRRLQHPVGAAGDAGRERAQHDGVERRDRRHQIEHGVVGTDAERMKQVGGRGRALLQLAIGHIDRRAVRIAVRDIADRHLLRSEVEPVANPVVGIPGQQPLFERDALQLFDIAQITERTEPACGVHCRCRRNSARSRCGVTGSCRDRAGHADGIVDRGRDRRADRVDAAFAGALEAHRVERARRIFGDDDLDRRNLAHASASDSRRKSPTAARRARRRETPRAARRRDPGRRRRRSVPRPASD